MYICIGCQHFLVLVQRLGLAPPHFLHFPKVDDDEWVSVKPSLLLETEVVWVFPWHEKENPKSWEDDGKEILRKRLDKRWTICCFCYWWIICLKNIYIYIYLAAKTPQVQTQSHGSKCGPYEIWVNNGEHWVNPKAMDGWNQAQADDWISSC
jgi:hypothetical protein